MESERKGCALGLVACLAPGYSSWSRNAQGRCESGRQGSGINRATAGICTDAMGSALARNDMFVGRQEAALEKWYGIVTVVHSAPSYFQGTCSLRLVPALVNDVFLREPTLDGKYINGLFQRFSTGVPQELLKHAISD